MVTVAENIEKAGLESRMIMQVHDELVFEGPESEMEALGNVVRDSMENALPGCRLPVDMGIGKNWSEAK